MADHSSDPNDSDDSASSRAGRRIQADAASLGAFSIPAPASPVDTIDAPPSALSDSDDDAGAPRRSRGRRTPRTDWRLGGHTVRPWREALLAVALITLALALLAAALLEWLWVSPFSRLVATGVVWVSLGGVVVYALTRARPVGLFRFRALDLLYGVGFALILRVVQGWIEIGERGVSAFPSAVLIGGSASIDWWAIDVAGAVAIAPVVEELFFRGVVLVAVYSALRRPFGIRVAGVAALLVSTGLFVVVHAVAVDADLSGTLSLLLLGTVCSALVLLTGRIWGAVLVHIGYNASYVALLVVGTFWG